MPRYREIIELRSVGLSYEKVAFLAGCSAQKAAKVVSRAAELGLEWPVPAELDDDELKRLIDEPPSLRTFPIDFQGISQTARENGSGKKAALSSSLQEAWEAYLESARESELPPLSRSSFNRQYKAWLQANARPILMRVNWTPAEEVQVDWAGKSIPLHSREGDVTPAYLFVATMPYSGYTFVRASLDMSMQSWLEHHRALFNFLSGVPMFIAPDNTSTAVTFKRGFRGSTPLWERRVINRIYQDLADHYGIIVVPARVQAPQDKAAVEVRVRNMANRFVKLLEQMRFTSIEQLNAAISKLTEIYNDKTGVGQMFDVSSREAFLLYEAPFLAPLPNEPFTSVTWAKTKASPDAVITVRGVHYGLPSNHAGKEVRVRISDAFIDVYEPDGQQKIAHHVRGEDGSHTFEGFAGRRPDRFKPLSEWAEQNGRHALLGQWHPTKNEELAPEGIVCRSRKEIWWRCGECGYEWQETPLARTSRAWDDCLACANVDLVPGRNDLATLYPDIAAEWHPTKNGCGPSEVFPDQTLNVWWKGSNCGHEWLCKIKSRTKSAFGRLCPYCSGRKALPGFNDVKTLCPELAALWHPAKNRQNKPDATAVLAKRRVFLQKGMFGETWLESPRSWMIRNGYADVLKPFFDMIERAQEEDRERKADVASGDPHALSKKRKRERRYRKLSSKPMSLEEWCKKNGRERLLEEWHPTKNKPLSPASISYGSKKSVWWVCEKGHEWEADIMCRRALDHRCPVCFPNGRILPGLTDLSSRSVSFLKYYSADNDLPASQISDHHNGSLLWECPDCGKRWRASIDRFPEQRGSCPFCDKWESRLLCTRLEKLDLASRFPRTAACWHPSKNDGLQPDQVRPYSLARVWWLCPDCGREWQESVRGCVDKADRPCPFCLDRWTNLASEGTSETGTPPKHCSPLIPGYNDLATVKPQIAAEWHPTKNGRLMPSDVTPGSSTSVWWRCARGHEWEAGVCERSRGRNCPYCSSHRVLAGFNDLATLYPRIAEQWHEEKNGSLRPSDVSGGSAKMAWWRCPHCGGSWLASVSSRTRTEGYGCPECTAAKRGVRAEGSTLKGRTLASVRPEIVGEWHPTKNGPLKPEDLKACSKRKIWWRCARGHEWEAEVYERSRGRNCPYCSNHRLLAGFNDLATLYPRIAEQWDPSKNGSLKPSDVPSRSKRKVWWRCPHCGGSWLASVANRAKSVGYGCPECTSKRPREKKTPSASR